MARTAERDPLDRVLAQQQRTLEEKVPPPSPVAPGFDREGMPPLTGIGGLAELEQNAFRRVSPWRNRWPEVQAFDDRVADLERRQTEVTAELQHLNDRLSTVDLTDAQDLARWELSDRDGPRPEPKRPRLEEAAARLRQTFDGLTAAMTQVLAEKAAYVEKHRARLVREADRQTGEAHARVVALVDELAVAREELRGLRSAALWAATYPDPAAGRQPPNTLAGARRRALEQAGITGQVAPDRLFDLLRADADWLRDAMSPEQQAIVEGRDPSRPPDVAWGGTPEALEMDRAEKREALRRYREMWGRDPA